MVKFANKLHELMKSAAVSIFVMLSLLLVHACRKGADVQPQPDLMEASRRELASAVEERDELMRLVTAITGDMDDIRRMENILSSQAVNDNNSIQTEQIMADMATICRTLAKRRAKLDLLESKLKESTLFSSDLQDAINALRRQIDSRNKEINRLRLQLDSARLHIGSLSMTVDSLHCAVDTLSFSRDRAEQTAMALENELNICYYAIASKSELKQHRILETGFLRKSRLLNGDFDRDFFLCGDKRSLRSVELHSRKARLLTNHPEGSYCIAGEGSLRLEITNPARFWSTTNFMVIQTD